MGFWKSGQCCFLGNPIKRWNSLDAVEAGIKIPEADPNNQTVGYGGLPDRDGHVTWMPVSWIRKAIVDLVMGT